MVMLERLKKALDNKNKFAALLTDLSKAFDCLHRLLLIAKLDAYGFDHKSLNIILSYLSRRQQRTKVNNHLSVWADILSGIPQGSILGPLIFNIYINDIYYFILEDRIAKYVDDTTPYTIKDEYAELIDSLQLESNILLDWFKNPFFKLTADKCKLLVANKQDDLAIYIEKESAIREQSVKLLVIKIDNKLTFNEYISNLCKKVNNKLHGLARVSHFMDQNKLKILLKAVMESQFSYCPLIWMFHTRSFNNQINNLHERALRLVYKDHSSSFAQLLDKDNSFSIHERNLQKLAIEMYKVKNNLSPSYKTKYFSLQ